ncbi:hypothetical protein [Marilutibacter chinensis]|uniref:Glycosyl transferase family 2 n=1 Tax=Marilutibacter chinensis TaxID=2912247 RepID=A0ABS9HY20_9GAMM|nr:hypothetical protein [Lysobacter chinensis]MCF7223764.1 hypothetical protein [Lysobacter chinensis]
MTTSSAAPAPDELLSALTSNGIECFWHIEDDVRSLVDAAIVERHAQRSDMLSIFVAPVPPPKDRVRRDPPTRSFIASGAWVRSFPAAVGDRTDACYRVVRHALSGHTDVPEIRIYNGVDAIERDLGYPEVEFIIPHRGSNAHLDVCLSGVCSQSLDCRASVCLDESSDWRPVRAGRRVRLFKAEDPPVGPYAIRQFLSMNSSAEYLAFQDSDDFSLPSRLTELLTARIESGADIVGSHELRLDEIEHAVIPVRFPLDVNAALREVAEHPQLFPTTVALTATVQRIGGFSTIRMFGGDTEYLLRAHFLARIINIDRFVYIRRRREGSLTTAPETALGSPARVELGRIWRKDFEEIKKGRLALEHSSLALRHGPAARIVAADDAERTPSARTTRPRKPATAGPFE